MRNRLEGRHKMGLMTLEMPEGSRVSDVFAELDLIGDVVRVLMVNGRPIKDNQLLKDGDRLGLFPRELAFNVCTAISFFNPLARKKDQD